MSDSRSIRAVPFRIDEHLKRLQATLDGIKLANPLTAEGWKEVFSN